VSRNPRPQLRARRRLAVVLALAALALTLAAVLGKGAARRARALGGGAHAAHHATAKPARSARELPPGEGANEALESSEIRHLISLGKPIYCAGPHGNEVALTFDDGPGQYTRLADAKLGKHHIKATFFIVGRNIQLMPDAVRKERELGAVGDHTYTHPLLTSLSPAEAEAEIVRTQQAVERSSGGPVFLFRPPYGALDATVDGIARAHNLLPIMWTVDSRDSLGANYAQIESTVIAGMRPGAIILMHENHGQTIRAMLSIFAALARKHLRAVSVPRLLSNDPPSDAQVRAGGSGCGSLYRPGPNGG
jgi:peptidoglycan/xylan/chitin deacetylase (PgdA/CDA1 family)